MFSDHIKPHTWILVLDQPLSINKTQIRTSIVLVLFCIIPEWYILRYAFLLSIACFYVCVCRGFVFFKRWFAVHPATSIHPVMADMTDLPACQVPSVQSLCHVTLPAAWQKLIVLIGERQSCNKALRGDPPAQMKALRFVLCQGLVGNRSVRWPAGQEGRTTAVWLACTQRKGRGQGT